MDIGKQFRTDRTKEAEGAWVPLMGSKFLIARANNRAYRMALAKALKDNADALNATTAEADALDDRLLAEVMAATILLDWKDVDLDGKPVKYSEEVAAKLMTEMPDFCELIREHAQNIENFRVTQEDTEAKNS